LHAMSSTVGKMKIQEMKRRLVDISPMCNVTLIYDFVSDIPVLIIFFTYSIRLFILRCN